MEESNLKHILMKQQARYNGKVGLYPTNNIEQFKLNWSSSWGPTPMHWHYAEDKDFTIDYGSIKRDFISYIDPSYYTYSTTKNNLPVVTALTSTPARFETTFTPDSIGYNTTTFVVVRPWNHVSGIEIVTEASYNPSATPNITGSTTICIPKSGFIYGVSSYTSDYGTNQTNLMVAATYSSSQWYIIVHKGKSSLVQTSTGTINGKTMSATASSLPAPIPSTGHNGLAVEIKENGVGLLAELIVYDSILSGANTTLVENYLKSKWAITY